ncbi:hypothetical protein VCHC46B1_2546 [Vibrio cholerae HC-46B1]|nr:hypothetical protein VCHC41B1_2091 [Vibrio cholerae HC-41B1]EKL95611.1 hypothetical protein VCHC46B1_2546 [Vibrio cholerae HC-46B1]
MMAVPPPPTGNLKSFSLIGPVMNNPSQIEERRKALFL